jgi:hypothetical protein
VPDDILNWSAQCEAFLDALIVEFQEGDLRETKGVNEEALNVAPPAAARSAAEDQTGPTECRRILVPSPLTVPATGIT